MIRQFDSSGKLKAIFADNYANIYVLTNNIHSSLFVSIQWILELLSNQGTSIVDENIIVNVTHNYDGFTVTSGITNESIYKTFK